jgi:hypothetical protein
MNDKRNPHIVECNDTFKQNLTNIRVLISLSQSADDLGTFTSRTSDRKLSVKQSYVFTTGAAEAHSVN